jgi:hypothetical protein
MKAQLVSMGLRRSYFPFQEEGEGVSEAVLLEVRNPPSFADGVMTGAEIDIYDNHTVRVWTSQKNKAIATARANGFKIRLFDGEAELYIPADKADQFLHAFGARVKKSAPPLTPERLAALRAQIARINTGGKERLAVAV